MQDTKFASKDPSDLKVSIIHAMYGAAITVTSLSAQSRAPHVTLTHNFSSIWLGGPGGCLNPMLSLGDSLCPISHLVKSSFYDFGIKM